MIQARFNFSFLRNKFFLLLGTIITLTLLIYKFEASNENTLLGKIKKLELQNEAYKKQFEGNPQTFELLPLSTNYPLLVSANCFSVISGQKRI